MGAQLNMKISLSTIVLFCKKIIVGVGLVCLVAGCGKKSGTQRAQAQNYYKLCMVELSEDYVSDAVLRTALNYIEKALQLDLKPQYQATCATILFKLSQCERSIAHFKKALAATDCSRLRGEILNNMACVYAAGNEVHKAKKIWEKLIKAPYYLTPEVALINLAKLALHDDSYSVAKEYCSKAITLCPTYIDAHFYLAMLSYKTNDLSLAKKEVGVTLFMEPGHQGAKHLESVLKSV